MSRRETALELAVANAEEPNCQSWQPTVAALIIACCGGDAGKIDQHWCVRAFPLAPLGSGPAPLLVQHAESPRGLARQLRYSSTGLALQRAGRYL